MLQQQQQPQQQPQQQQQQQQQQQLFLQQPQHQPQQISPFSMYSSQMTSPNSVTVGTSPLENSLFSQGPLFDSGQCGISCKGSQ